MATKINENGVMRSCIVIPASRKIENCMNKLSFVLECPKMCYSYQRSVSPCPETPKEMIWSSFTKKSPPSLAKNVLFSSGARLIIL